MHLLGSHVASASAVRKIRQGQRAEGPASVLSIGTANPAMCVGQSDYADFYCRITKCEHDAAVKAKLKKLCQASGITKRYFHHTEELLLQRPGLLNSLDARMDVMATAVPELAAAAAADAIAEWGRPAAEITDLVVSTYSGAHMPGPDLHLASLLGLRPSVRRTMLYLYGCSSGSAALRVAKDIAENNRGARVLVACADLTLMFLREPDDMDTLIMQSRFGDGAGAAVIGADCMEEEAAAGFEMVSASQARLLPEPGAEVGQIRDIGLVFHPSRNVPSLISDNIERCVSDALLLAPPQLQLGLDLRGGWNDLFWAVHPGGRAMLDSVEAGLQLEPGKLMASRLVLSEYGNMSGPSVIFVLDELRRRRQLQENDLGVMLGLGPGLTVETMLLRATAGSKK